MARSSVIYVVIDEYGKPRAAFTVKHEMETWAERNGGDRWTYVRMSDGDRRKDMGGHYELHAGREVR